MRVIGITVVCAVLLLAKAGADAITVNGIRHEGVYVDVSPRMVYVRFPETGKVESFSSETVGANAVEFDDDPVRRATLLEQWKANRTDGAATPQANNAPPVASSEGHNSPNPAPTTGDFDAFALRKRLKTVAHFEAALLHWQATPREIRGQLLESFGLNLDSLALETELTLEQLITQQQAYREAARGNTQAVNDYAQRQSTAFERAYEEQPSLGWNKLLRDSAIDRSLYYRVHGFDTLADITHNSAHYYDYQVRRGYEEADARANAEIGQVELQKRREIAQYKANQAAAEFVERHAYRREKQLGAMQWNVGREAAFVASLTDALENGYEDMLYYPPVAEWQDFDGRTEPFRIATGVWRIDWWSEGALGGAGAIEITVYASEDNRPVARASNDRAPYLHFEILERPGEYYLDIRQKAGSRSYITVSEVLN
jgi:hypothetical protein